MDFNFQNFNPRNIFPESNGYINSRSVGFLFLLFVFIFYFFALKPPADFPRGELVIIEKGSGLSEISSQLEEGGLVKSPFWLGFFVRILGGEIGALAGDYRFTDPVNSFRIARKITRGEFGLVPIKITMPEGSTIFDIADIMSEDFPKFDKDQFLMLAREEEGYLFPDTYNFLPNIEASEAIRFMRSNFDNRVGEIEKEIEGFGEPLEDIIIMASLLEKEARTTETRRIISGILWERLKIGMPLQVDAVFPYINGKNTYQLSLQDLEIDSPYNTYKYKGLPIGPIANPGLDSILSAVTPIKTDYLFYLSDRSGNMYYAEDFEGHKRNRRLYLD